MGQGKKRHIFRIGTCVACHTVPQPHFSAVEDLVDIIQEEMRLFKMHRKCRAVITYLLVPHF